MPRKERVPAFFMGLMAFQHLYGALFLAADMSGYRWPAFFPLWTVYLLRNRAHDMSADERLAGQLTVVFLLIGIALVLRYLAEALWKRNGVVYELSLVISVLFSLLTIPAIATIRFLTLNNLQSLIHVSFLILPTWGTVVALLFALPYFHNTEKPGDVKPNSL